ncbi:hypothetical protein [Variovorax sp. OV084]|jgi:hypothetical protein|nr:hypothetical protein [Variovorax sp. OV084]
MSKVSILLMALVATAMGAPTHAADKRYPLDSVRKIEVVEPSSGSVWEDKNLLDCSDVVLTEEDVRYALRHIRRVTEKAFFSEETERTGCSGGASVTFRNGKIIVIGVEPTGRINIFEANAKLEPTGVPESYYGCDPCRKRKMILLQDAFDRADERRLKKLVAQGRISSTEAELLLQKARSARKGP